MTSAQVVETSVNVISNSPSQDYTHPDDRTLPYDMTPGFKPFTKLCSLGSNVIFHSGARLWLLTPLPFSRIWYVASLIHMPPWVLRMLNSLIFYFFWKTKCKLVSRAVVVQPPSLGGFSVVNIKLKVSSLLNQWVRHFTVNPSGWTILMTYWVLVLFRYFSFCGPCTST